ncbi:hypothetical protein MesoLjLb_16900 [Mesorhizobium sp. L-8-3]|nr:hypothetical protein MesoLjLb_16900 [Mesorhizobium sp. L-8-3]
MHYVYLIESLSVQGQRYVGLTTDLRRRLEEHNAGKSLHTSKFKPWRLTTYIAFADQAKAIAFERYLKSGSGHASQAGACGRPSCFALTRYAGFGTQLSFEAACPPKLQRRRANLSMKRPFRACRSRHRKLRPAGHRDTAASASQADLLAGMSRGEPTPPPAPSGSPSHQARTPGRPGW